MYFRNPHPTPREAHDTQRDWPSQTPPPEQPGRPAATFPKTPRWGAPSCWPDLLVVFIFLIPDILVMMYWCLAVASILISIMTNTKTSFQRLFGHLELFYELCF